jgi:hypothetical protein
MFSKPFKVSLLFTFYFLFSFTIVLAQPISGSKTVCTTGCDYPTLNAAV